VLHSRVGRDHYQTLEAYAERRGCSLTQALRDVLSDLKQRELEDTSGTRLESLARTLTSVVEQQARHATRLEAVVAIIRKVEEGQAERESQILQTLAVLTSLSQHTYAYLMGVVESSPRAADIVTSGKAKLLALRGEA
jgi:iron-sulfur cluster repair protein YtfE (RIC family)